MAGHIKLIQFFERKPEIPLCFMVNLKFEAGDVLAQYQPASEVQLSNGTWQYAFYIQEEDLPGAMTMDEVANCNVVSPYFECAVAVEPPEEPCPSRLFNCFEDLDILEGIQEGSYIGILEYDESCNTFCLKAYPASDFLPEATPERDALDYEVFAPGEILQTGMETYVTNVPRQFLISPTIRVSVAQIGTGTLTFNIKVNGINLTTAVISMSGVQTLVIPLSSLSVTFQNGNPLPDGAVVTARIETAPYDAYGTNWEGLRVSMQGTYVS